MSKKTNSVEQITHEGATIFDNKTIANHFNFYFHNVFTASNEPLHIVCQSNDDVPDIVPLPDVSLLLNLKTKTSTGPGQIPNTFLRRYAEMLSEFLIIIFRASIPSGRLPRDWKVGRIAPVHKKGDNDLVPNYRPISMTSSSCKVLEHIIAKVNINFLNENNILSDVQHGFRKGFSTETQLTSVVHCFLQILDKAGQVDAFFLDFTKTFDLVPHDQLLQKLKSIGLPEFIISWIYSYLSDRVQFVSIAGNCSDPLPVTYGVPKGSVLGPLISLIYINDIVRTVSAPVQIRLFADDCVLFNEITSHDDQILLNTNLHNIFAWCELWKMKFNTDKTVFMRVSNKKTNLQFTYKFGTRTLAEVVEYKYLGVSL